jgi:hypothetical protein
MTKIDQSEPCLLSDLRHLRLSAAKKQLSPNEDHHEA